ncbi:hypothetical protein [Kitasatospora sp. NPDC057015]|uniref:hypothetical protein n=1 Tax=Kitasatospora sp. NPDC057015 TaxID=3346001 RepID=UPI00362E23E0
MAALAVGDGEHIVLTPEADVWAIGASLIWAWTRLAPTDYRSPEVDRDGLLADTVAGWMRPLETSRPWPFPALENGVRACLTVDPARRPTAPELVTVLRLAADPEREVEHR